MEEIKDTTILEMVSIYSLVPLLSYLSFLIFNIFNKNSQQSKSLNIILTLVLQAFPIAIIFVILGEYVFHILGVLLVLTFVILLLYLIRNSSKIISHIKRTTSWYQLSNLQVTSPSEHLPFLTSLRVFFSLEVTISILAVDFNFFPHRFLKTETFGLGLMDLGVGIFSFLNGISSYHGREMKEKIGFNYFKKSLKSALPLILLGILRIVLIKVTGYHSNISEYGVHWNFFLTLAFCKIATSFILSFMPPQTSGLIGLLIIVCYQAALSYFNLDTWLMSEQRDSLFMANKEGIVSLLGFIVLYLLGVDLGRFLHQPKTRLKSWVSCTIALFVSGSVLALLFNFLHYGPLPASRRIANLSYCLWINAIFRLSLCVDMVLFLFKKILISLQLVSDISAPLWDIINKHLLFFFLFSNILTGAVNLSTKPEAFSRLTAVIVICVYVSVASAGCFVWEEGLKKFRARNKQD